MRPSKLELKMKWLWSIHWGIEQLLYHRVDLSHKQLSEESLGFIITCEGIHPLYYRYIFNLVAICP